MRRSSPASCLEDKVTGGGHDGSATAPSPVWVAAVRWGFMDTSRAASPLEVACKELLGVLSPLSTTTSWSGDPKAGSAWFEHLSVLWDFVVTAEMDLRGFSPPKLLLGARVGF